MSAPKPFWDDGLFGDLIHPHRKEYPEDNVSMRNSHLQDLVTGDDFEAAHTSTETILQELL